MTSKLLSFGALCLFLAGCSTAVQQPVPLKSKAIVSPVIPDIALSYSDLKPRYLRGFDEFKSHSDKKEVKRYLSYYQGGNGLRFLKDGVARMRSHQSEVTEVLSSYNLPRELLSVPLIESRFKRNARSPRGAVGVWQLTRGAASKGGISSSERRDIVKSTYAASEYIVDLYDLFEDWPLALAAFNGGRTRVQRAIKKSGSRDFFYLAENNFLPSETKSYVPKVLAVSHLLCQERVICE